MAADALRYRPATARDAARLAAVMAEGMATYRAFAPGEYSPPTTDAIVADIAERLETPPVWCLLAESDGEVAGYVALMPATQARIPSDEPGLMHFWMLFVRAPFWGSGVASRLHDAACAEAAARGFTALRLFTPADHGRARRFYEREGWTLAGGSFHHDELHLDMVEYRRPVPHA